MRRLSFITERISRHPVKTAAALLGSFVLLVWLLLWLIVPSPLFSTPCSTLLYSSDNQLLGARIAADEQWRFPAADSVSEKFAKCIVAFEDKRFYKHFGVDPVAVGRAAWSNLKARKIVSGGSSITMQVARLARGGERTFYEKAVEMFWAVYIETRYSKQEILSLYTSHAPFGGNVVGLGAASWRYFGREANRLSWAEAATLAVLPNSPALIHPGRNREKLLEKRNRLLQKLLQNGTIDETTYRLSCLEPLPSAPMPLPNEAPHLLARLSAETGQDRIKSTVNRTLQTQCQNTVNYYAAQNAANHIYNIAALIADVETGEVLAYAGNATNLKNDNASPQVDIIPSQRSTGSILKPFLYAAMLHNGDLLPGTLVADIPLNIGGFVPQNYNKSFQGCVPARQAIEQSLNVPLVRMLTTYNAGRFLSLLKQTGMTTLRFSEDHYGASLILGGAEGSLWDLTGMYASLARTLSHYRLYNGKYNKSDIHALSAIPIPEEEVITDLSDPALSEKPLYSAASIWYTFETMSALSRPEEEADWQQFNSMKKIAWKTGTSYGNRDAWAIGVTPTYVVGVWVGNASGEGRPGLTGVGSAAPVLFDLFSLLPPARWFDMPFDELEKTVVCRKSGHRASSICEETDSMMIPSSGRNTPQCPYHKQVHLSPDLRFRVTSACEPVGRMVVRSWFVLPPAQEYYYRQRHVDYEVLPPMKPGCGSENEKQIELIYPEQNAILLLPRGFDGEKGKCIFKAAHARPEATLYWHLDDAFIGSTTTNHELSCTPTPGKHRLTLVDETGNRLQIRFETR